MIKRILLFLFFVLFPVNHYTQRITSAMQHNIVDIKHSIEQKMQGLPYSKAPRENLAPSACFPSSSPDLSAIEQALCTIQRAIGCAATPISSSTTITTPNTVYCLTQDVGFIIIDTHDVTLLMNGRSITEFLEITSNGQRTIVQKGKIIAAPPTTMSAANAGAVQIAAGASNSILTFCFIQPMDTTTPDVNGMIGINNAADNVVISHCEVYGSASGPANTLVPIGGGGIVNTGTNLLVTDCFIAGGDGNESTNGTVSSTHGGDGMITSAASTTCSNLFIMGGTGGDINASSGDIANGISVIVGNGGNGVVYNGGFSPLIVDSHIVGGAGGNATAAAGSIALNGGQLTTGSGSSGIVVTNFTDGSTIRNCFILGGAGGATTAFNDIANNGTLTSSSAGNGLTITGGAGIFVENSIAVGFMAGTVTATQGTIGNNSGIVQGGNGGSGINASNAFVLSINNCSFIGNSARSIVTASPIFAPGTIAIANVNSCFGGTGIFLQQSTALITIQECNVLSGSGAAINATSGSIDSSVFGGFGGEGIHIESSEVMITDITIMTQGGGNISASAPLTSNLGTAGNGGNGVTITGNFVSADKITVLETGSGGDIFTSGGPSGTGGNGGDGIFIDLNANNNKVNNCSITNTGRAGFAAVLGLPGEAINDQGNGSAIYGNMAIYIAASPQYILTVGSAIDAPNGTNFFAIGNDHPLANIWK